MTSYEKHHCCCPTNPFLMPAGGKSCWGCSPPKPCPCPDGAPFCWDEIDNFSGCPSARCGEGFECVDNDNEDCCQKVCSTMYCCCDRAGPNCTVQSNWLEVGPGQCDFNCGDALCDTGEYQFYGQWCPCIDGTGGGGCNCANCQQTGCNMMGAQGGGRTVVGDYSYVVSPDGECVWMDCGMGDCPYPLCLEGGYR